MNALRLAMDGKEARLELYKRDDARRLIAWLLKGNEDIKPKRDPQTGDYVYPGIENPKLFSELESHNILEKYEVDQVPACPSCNHSNFHLDYVCPFSKHRSLERGTMIEHYACGHTDFEDKFKSGSELICPKCQRPLKLIGTEYRKTELVFHCSGCGKYFGSPVVEMTCRVCGKAIKQDEAILQPIFGYKLKEELRSELVAHATLETQIAELFQKFGYEVTTPKVIRGLSGVDHTFDVHASKGGSEIAADLVSATTDIGPESVAGFFAKVFDAKPQRAILIAIPKLNQEAQKLSAMYSIETVSADQVEDILKNLSSLLEPQVPHPSPPPIVPELPPTEKELRRGDSAESTVPDDLLRQARAKMARIKDEVDRRLS